MFFISCSADFFYGHGFYSQELRKEIVKSCGDWSNLSPRCLKALYKMEQEIGSDNSLDFLTESWDNKKSYLDPNDLGFM